MKKLTSIAAFLWCFCMGAQNWVFHPGTGAYNYPVHRFWNDTLNNRLLGVGVFDSIGGIYSPGFAQWNGTTWGTTGTEIYSGPYCATFGCVTEYNGDIVLDGSISSWSISRNFIMRWNGTTFDSIGSFANSSAISMIQYQNTLVVGIPSDYDSINNVPFNAVAAWDGNNWFDMGQGLLEGAIHSMVVYRDTLYLGAFSSADNYPYVFRYVNGAWETVGPRFYGAIYNLCVYNDELYAGSYNSGNGIGKAISKYDAATGQWIAPGGGIFSSWGFSEVESMAVMEGRLYAMGDFDHAGGVNANLIAAWDGTQWCGLGNDTTWAMRQIVAFDNSIYLSTGNFFDDSLSTLFVEWIGDNYSDSCGIFDGVDELQTNFLHVNVFPNPTSDNVTFQIFGEPATRTIILIDNLGREIWREETRDNEVRLSTESFGSGLYFYRIEESGEVKSSGKLIVE